MASALINGILPIIIPTTGQKVFIVGGPYRNYLQSGVRKFAGGACLVEQQPTESHVWLPIQDFSVPKEAEHDAVTDAIEEVLKLAITDGIVWVGCAGGWGRTGLFMALIAKACGEQDDPVGYVRKHYTPHAVETAEQQNYVKNFDTRDIESFLDSLFDPDSPVLTTETVLDASFEEIVERLDELEYPIGQRELDRSPELDPAAPFFVRVRRAFAILFGRG